MRVRSSHTGSSVPLEYMSPSDVDHPVKILPSSETTSRSMRCIFPSVASTSESTSSPSVYVTVRALRSWYVAVRVVSRSSVRTSPSETTVPSSSVQ